MPETTPKTTFSYYLKVIWRRRLLIIFFALLAAFITGIISMFFIRPIYSSHANMVIYPEKEALTIDIGAMAGIPDITKLKASPLELEISIMTSSAIIGSVVDKLNLQVDRKKIPNDYRGQQIIGAISTNKSTSPGEYCIRYIDDAGDFKVYRDKDILVGSGSNNETFYGGGLRFTLSDPNPKKNKKIKFEVFDRNELVKEMTTERVMVWETPRGTVEISSHYYDPVTAQSIISVLLDTYIESNYSHNQMATNESLRLLKERMNEVKKEKDELQDKITKFQQKEGILYIGEENTAIEQQIAELKIARTMAEIQKSVILYFLEEVETDDKIPPEVMASLLPLLSDGNVSYLTMMENFDTLLFNLEFARTTYTEESPMVQEQVDLLNRLKAALSDRMVETLRANLNALDSQISELRFQFDDMLAKLPPKLAELFRLVTNYKELASIYNALLVQYEAERVKEIQQKSRYAKIRVLSPPSLNLAPVKPKKKLNVTVAFSGGIFLGIIIALLIEFIDYSPFERKHPYIMATLRFPGRVWRGFWGLFKRKK